VADSESEVGDAGPKVPNAIVPVCRSGAAPAVAGITARAIIVPRAQRLIKRCISRGIDARQ